MAKKFLPFVADDASHLDLFVALIGYAEVKLPPRKLAALFYTVLNTGLEEIRKFTYETRSNGNSELDVINSILNNYSNSIVSRPDVSRYVKLGKYLLKHEFTECYGGITDTDLNIDQIMVFLYVLCIAGESTGYTTLDLNAVIDKKREEVVFSDLNGAILFDDTAEVMFFDDLADLKAYIMFSAAWYFENKAYRPEYVVTKTVTATTGNDSHAAGSNAAHGNKKPDFDAKNKSIFDPSSSKRDVDEVSEDFYPTDNDGDETLYGDMD